MSKYLNTMILRRFRHQPHESAPKHSNLLISILLTLITTTFLTNAQAFNKAEEDYESPLDRQIAKIQRVYSLSDGWDLSLRSPSSLSSQYAQMLAHIDNRDSRYFEPLKASSDGDREVEGKGLSIKSSVMKTVASEFDEATLLRLNTWQKLAQITADLNPIVKLTQVNNFFNAIEFKEDFEQWGQEDYWSTPLEFLLSNGGDCEDFAIAKYFTLKAMGIPADRLRIVYVKASRLNQAHMVLAYYEELDQSPWILDNLNPYLLRADQRKDLIPVHSFNG